MDLWFRDQDHGLKTENRGLGLGHFALVSPVTTFRCIAHDNACTFELLLIYIEFSALTRSRTWSQDHRSRESGPLVLVSVLVLTNWS